MCSSRCVVSLEIPCSQEPHMTSQPDLRTTSERRTKKKSHFPTCVFQLDCPIWIHTSNISTKRRESARGQGRKESKARGPAKREQQATTIPASDSSGVQPFQPVKRPNSSKHVQEYKRNINYNKKYCSSLDDRR